MHKTARLRQLLGQERILIAPGAYDALSARLCELAGFQLAHATGAGISCVQGYPDVGLLTATEVLYQVQRMVAATQVPIIADADTGYGNAINVFRTVRDFEQAGVAGIHIEDQVAPKKCGLLEGKAVVSIPEMAAKIRAATDARTDPDFVVIARTDVRPSGGFTEVIRRIRAYADAGADMVFVYGAESEQEMREIPRAVPVPVMTHISPGGKVAHLTARDLEVMGYRLVIFALSPLEAVAQTLKEFLADLRTAGTDLAWRERMVSYRELYDTVGLSTVEDMERRYAAEEA